MYQRMTIVLFSVFVFAVAGRAQQDPFLGAWKINTAKSRYDPGPPPKSGALKIELSGSNARKITSDGVNAQGKTTHSEYIAYYDGKDYPMQGSPSSDTVATRRIDANTRIRVDKKGGDVVGMMLMVVSKDGNTLTVDAIGVNAQGRAFHSVSVADKQ